LHHAGGCGNIRPEADPAMPRLPVRTTGALLVALGLLAGGLGAQRAATAVPTPRAVLGFTPGDDYRLADFGQVREYFRRLADASPRVELFVAGTSTEGRDILVAVISSEANLSQLERYRDIGRRLALVEGVSDDEARALARDGKAIVWIDSGLHSNEVATSQHAFQLAYQVATDESREMQEIRENVILLLLPCINPDGMELYVDWYRRHVGTPHQDSPMPWLYHRYVGHDNNRDGYMQTQKETQVVNRLLFHEWLPQVMYNQHQGVWPARIFVPPFPDPVNPHIDPQIVRGVDLVGAAMQDRFEREGKAGVINRYLFSIWYNGSVRTTTYFHNIIGILTETGHASATPFTYRASDFPQAFSNGVPTLAPSVTYPNPWRGGTLRLRDAVEYMLTGSLGVLDVASKYRERFLYGIYQVGARQVEAGRAGAPFAYIVPDEQHDLPAAMRLLETLMKGAVDVHRADAPFAADGIRYPAGTHVILLAQPFRPFVRDLLEPQVYPDVRSHPAAPPVPPYDTAGWTLSYQMGVRTVAVERPFDTSVLSRLAAYPRAAGRLVTAGVPNPWGYAIEPSANNAVIAVNRLLARGYHVERARRSLQAAPGHALRPGAWVVRADGQARETAASADVVPDRAGAVVSDDIADLVAEFGLQVVALAREPAGERVPARAARIGLYKSWVANMDEGWTRWLLEQYGFPYVSLTNADVRAGDLRHRLDVIILPAQGATAIVDGHQPWMRPTNPPRPWNPPPPEYQGGMGEEGVAALQQFVREGGTLVTFDEASELVLDRFGGPFARISSVTRGLRRSDFYGPGSVLRVEVDPEHPVAWGMPAWSAAYFQNSRAFETNDSGVRSIARYAAADGVLMSGWLLGAHVVGGRHAAIEVPFGDGRVVLFAFRPQFRAQPHATFKLVFNALY
jgi:hypothetical protein